MDAASIMAKVTAYLESYAWKVRRGSVKKKLKSITLSSEPTMPQKYPLVNKEVSNTPRIYTGIILESVKPKRYNATPSSVVRTSTNRVMRRSFGYGMKFCQNLYDFSLYLGSAVLSGIIWISMLGTISVSFSVSVGLFQK